MLQQVRHAGLAVVLVARAHVIGQVDRGRGLGVIGDQQHLQAIGQPVLVDAFDRLHAAHAGRQRLRHGGRRSEGHRQEQ